MPLYRCPKCGRKVELPEGTYYCKECGPEHTLVLVKPEEEKAIEAVEELLGKPEDVISKFKEGCRFLEGELYESKGKVICEPAEDIRIVVNKKNLETKVYYEPAGLQRWGILSNVSFRELLGGQKSFCLWFARLPSYCLERKGAVIYAPPPLETFDEKLRYGVVEDFRKQYMEKVRRALRAAKKKKLR